MSTTTLPTGLVAGTYAIETSHSQATFTVRHAGISKVRGDVAIVDGTIVVPGGPLRRHRDGDPRPRDDRHPRRQA